MLLQLILTETRVYEKIVFPWVRVLFETYFQRFGIGKFEVSDYEVENNVWVVYKEHIITHKNLEWFESLDRNIIRPFFLYCSNKILSI
jgi:hypothetical protein